MKVLISIKAHEDINSIFEYIARDSIKYANETLKNIYSYIERLETSPYLGRYVPEFQYKNFRELIYKSYRIVYEISEELNIVYIHFIIHAKRDFNSFYNSYLKNKF